MRRALVLCALLACTALTARAQSSHLGRLFLSPEQRAQSAVLAEQLATVFLPQAMAPVVGFLILVGTILVRPTGIMGYRAKR